MIDQSALEAVSIDLAGESAGHRDFFLPVLRAIASFGGRARAGEVKRKVREMLTEHLSEKQLDFLDAKNRYGWVRYALKKRDLVGGEVGYWELTELGRAYVQGSADEPIAITAEIAESSEATSPVGETESVEVTTYHAYEVPLLSVMATPLTDRGEIFAALEAKLEGDLLPGDRRLMPTGYQVWRYRSAWALTNLKKAGYAENPSSGKWAITSAGRERLAADSAAWRASDYRGAKARVRVEGQRAEPARAESAPWSPSAWASLRREISAAILDQLVARIRPDLGPSPDRPLARNVILYGPPGTGKTYIAKRVGSLLAGDSDRLRIVQFHPSYAYEDFVQGLRPDIKQTQLRYELSRGPFLEIAETALEEPDAFFVLIIDEINRGDPARIFGELLYALEYRDEPIDLALGGELVVPANLVVIGTMNSVDRSVALVDYALRRRFGFVRVDPDPAVIAAVREGGVLAEVGHTVLERFNTWLVERLDQEHALGHSFFISPSIPDEAEDAFDRLWTSDVRPLLEEYFFQDADALYAAEDQWRQIVDSAQREREDLIKEDKEEESTDP